MKYNLGVLYINPSISLPGFCGGSTHVLELSRNLTKLGCKMYVLTRRLLGQSPSQLIDGVHVYRIYRGMFFPPPAELSSINKSLFFANYNQVTKTVESLYFNTVYRIYALSLALHLARKYNIDIILERGDSYAVGALTSMFTKKPLVTEVRDVYQPKISLILAKRILTYDASIIRDARFRSKAILMHGGVDVNKFKPYDKAFSKRALGIDVHKKVIGYSGSFTKTHRIQDIFNLVRDLQRLNFCFLMIGPYTNELLRKVEKDGLKRYFIFTGPVEHDKLPLYLSAMDLAIALYEPSKVAGPPYKVYEYMACGVPPVVTEIIYSKRIVCDGINGFLVKPYDTEDLCYKVERLMVDPDLRVMMSTEARKTALKYSWEEEARRILKVLECIG